MLRTALSALILLAAGGNAAAQSTADSPDPLVSFLLRPTEDPNAQETDPWAYSTEPELVDLDAAIGPPMAGPRPGDPIGPALAGPMPLLQEPVERPPRTEEAENPFEATGIRVGTFIIRPSIEIGVEATDNVRASSDKDSAVGLVVAPEISARSDGSRLDLDLLLRGSAVFYGDEETDDREGEARITATYELTPSTTLEAEAGYFHTLDDFSDPDTPAAAAERPPVDEFDAALGVTQEFGRLSIGLKGTIERELHEDVALAGGGTASLDEQNNTEYGLRLRTSVEASAALSPYVEVAGGRREYDLEVDSGGFRRSGPWGELRGGIVFDFGPKLSGDVAIGWRVEGFDDDQLEDIQALLAAASVVWSPRRLTELQLDLSTETRPTSVPGASGSVLYSGTLTLSRAITPRIKLEVGGGIDYERAIGDDWRDWTYSGFADVSYAFNRMAAVVARYSYERTDSNLPGGDYDANTVSLRLRLQR
jgi:hypothetical protein